jgi:hypothetical protein
MKTSPAVLLVVNAILAIGLTITSFQYVQPRNCYRLCDASEGKPCPSGACAFGEQKAGWPIPAFVDNPGGGSPTGGWGVLGPEDPPLGIPMILDVLFYSIEIWMVIYVIQFLSHQVIFPKLFFVSLPLNALMAVALWFFYYISAYVFGFAMIG